MLTCRGVKTRGSLTCSDVLEAEQGASGRSPSEGLVSLLVLGYECSVAPSSGSSEAGEKHPR